MQQPTTRYEAIDVNLFVQNRQKCTNALQPNSIAVLQANDTMPQSADGVFAFYQDSDLFYLTGIDQEETLLLLCRGEVEGQEEAILFLKKSDPLTTIWDGPRYSVALASKLSGIDKVYFLEDFPAVFKQRMAQATHLYLNNNEHLRASSRVVSRNRRFIDECKAMYPLHNYCRLAPIMGKLRTIKSAVEVALIQKAIDITHRAIRETVPLIRPGTKEYAIEGSLVGKCLQNGARRLAFSPIVANGQNACILHYISNNDICRAGDLVLVDVGAEYGNYHADITRVFPVSGRFSPRQKEVYNAVWHVVKEAKKCLSVGKKLITYRKEVEKIMEEQLLKLGLITQEEIQQQQAEHPAFKKYFMHGISHHLGLDTHDLSHSYTTIEAGMVLTVEPGIYIPAEGIGIRLEDDVLIKKDGVETLSEAIPMDPDEIEALMLADR